MRSPKHLLILVFCCSLFFAVAQEVDKISFKKNFAYSYFFQKGAKSDTLRRSKGDEFYLLFPDSLKENYYLFVENGKFEAAGDSTIRVRYLPGLKYESRYIVEEKTGRPVYRFITLMNGTSSLPLPAIVIQLYDKRRDKVLIKDRYYFAE